MVTLIVISRYIFQAMSNAGKLYIRNVRNKGRAVFSTKPILEGETIEICPVIVVAANFKEIIENTKLVDYCFYFNKEENSLSLAMGFGSMYNYQQYPNAVYELDRENKTMVYTACKDIPAHTEITINYGGEQGYDYSKWFLDRGITLV